MNVEGMLLIATVIDDEPWVIGDGFAVASSGFPVLGDRGFLLMIRSPSVLYALISRGNPWLIFDRFKGIPVRFGMI